MPSQRQQIIEGFRDRCALIQQSNGYDTDAGLAVFLGEIPMLGPDDPEQAIAILVLDDLPQTQDMVPSFFEIHLPLLIAAIARVGLSYPQLALEAVLGDIKKAVEHADLLALAPIKGVVRGQTSTLEKEEGSTAAGMAIEYTVLYGEDWGAP